MADETISIRTKTQAQDAIDAMRKLEDRARALKKEFKLTDAEARSLANSLTAAEKAEQKMLANPLKGNLEAVRKAAAGAGGSLGGMAGKLLNIAEAGSALGPIGLTLTAIAVGATGGALAMVALATASEDASKRLQPLREVGAIEPIDPEMSEAARALNDDFAVLSAQTDRLIEAIGGDLAKQMEPAFRLLAIGAERAVDLTVAMFEADAATREYSTALEGMRLIFGDVVDKIAVEADALAKESEARRKQKEAIEGVTNAVKAASAEASFLRQEEARADADRKKAAAEARAAAKAAAAEEERRTTGLAKYVDQLDQMAIASQRAGQSEEERINNDALDRLAKINEIEFAALDLARDSTEQAEIRGAAELARINSEYERKQELIALDKANAEERERLAKQAAEESKRAIKQAEDEAEARARAQQQQIDGYQGAANAALSFGSTLLDIAQDELQSGEHMTEAQKEAALELFKAQKAIALVQAAVNTALGVTAALQTPPPYGEALAIERGFAGAAEIATIAAQQPPSFFRGGIVDGVPQGGQVMVGMEPGEGALTQRGVDAAGGEKGLARMNRGEPVGAQGDQVIAVMLDHRVLNVYVNNARKRRGPLGNALRAAEKRTKVGKRPVNWRADVESG